MSKVFSTGHGKLANSYQSLDLQISTASQPLLTNLFWISMIEYPNYKFYFSIRALGKYEQTYLPWIKEHNELASTAY
jgi:hypothetical protein